jgi:Flp pilus assembly protein TadG
MRPKGKLLALVVMFAAVGLITATGAFTTVEAERTATVDVAGDSSALLQIEAANDIDEGAVSNADSGAARIDLNSAGLDDAAGLNTEANTTLTPLVNITNNGQNSVEVTISASTDEGNVNDVIAVDGSSNGFTPTSVGPGDSVQFGLIMDIGALSNGDNFDITIDITAEDDS